jgi:two-component system cell cycle sensor histidine kinase/response regulator CckA
MRERSRTLPADDPLNPPVLADPVCLPADEEAPFLRSILETSTEHSIIALDLSGNVVAWNEGARRLYGYEAAEIIGRSGFDLHALTGVTDGTAQTILAETLATGTWSGELTRRRKDGTEFGAKVTMTTRLDACDAVAGFTMISCNLTESRRRTMALRTLFDSLSESDRRYNTLFETINLVALTLTADARVEYVNPFFLEMTGYTAAEVMGRSWFEFLPPADLQCLRGGFQDMLERGGHEHYENPVLTKSGELRLIAWHNTVLRGLKGEPVGSLSLGEDVTDRRADEVALRETEARFRQLADNIREVFYISEYPSGACTYVSPAYEQIWGRTVESACAHPFAWAESFHPDDKAEITELFSHPLPRDGVVLVTRVVRPEGAIRTVRHRIFPVFDAAGAMTHVVGVGEDITDLREAEQKVSQVQKMEAVGQLAGGIAHDFNNLLAAITIFTELAQAGMKPDDPARDDLDQVHAAAKRAVVLTRQLLAFSRQQVLQPRVLDPNVIIEGVQAMLNRLIGEHIELEATLDPDAGFVRADAGQLEQVLLNLAVNARDAMPSGGRLTMRTEGRDFGEGEWQHAALPHAGRYVVMTVADNGHGMTEETRARVFEPFFTTKGRAGTGLGLATVYGIVQQSGGAVTVESEPGNGCTFRVFLPSVPGTPAASVARAAPEPQRGSETVLVTEDDRDVRTALKAVLVKLGYDVIAAANGADALAVARDHASPIHLLITDIVMPGMDGRDLATQLRAVQPGLKSLLLSGYTGSLALLSDLSPDTPFLEKPFTTLSLSRKVRDVLDGRPAGRRSSDGT